MKAIMLLSSLVLFWGGGVCDFLVFGSVVSFLSGEIVKWKSYVLVMFRDFHFACLRC